MHQLTVRTSSRTQLLDITSQLEAAVRKAGANDTAMVSAVRPEVMEQILKTVPVGRLATPAEIARAVVFLAADDAGFITGITLSVNGGKYLD